MKHKGLILLSLVLVIALALTGCGKIGGNITFWAMPNAPNDVHVAWMNQKAAEFEAKTGTKVAFEEVGWGDAWPRISTALATGEGADAFQVGTTWNPQFAATGGLSEINISEFGGKDSFMKANLESCTYKGKYYGVPWFAETRCLFYNKDIFDEVGVQPPKTTAELVEVGKKIIAKKGKGTAISIAGTTAWDLLHNWAIILYQNGGSLLSADNKKATFNDQAGIDAMKWYVGLVKDGLAADACAEYNQPQADAAFINGNVAMCYMGPWNVAGIQKDNPNLNYGVVEPPTGSKGKGSFSGGSNLVILKASKMQKQAKAWINFMVEEANLIDYTKNLSKMLPAKVNAFNDPYYTAGDFKVFKDTLSYATAYPPLGVWGSIETAVVDEFKNVLADYVNGKYNDNTAKTYLDKAAERVNAALANEK
jgi:multiple sugar transport system substrate-binding protein